MGEENPRPVGRKTRRAESVFPAFDLPRAGFEPLRGCGIGLGVWKFASSVYRRSIVGLSSVYRRSIVDHFGYLIGDRARTTRLKTDAMYINEGGYILGASNFSPHRSGIFVAHSPVSPFAASPSPRPLHSLGLEQTV
jgi:hypothetical protein